MAVASSSLLGIDMSKPKKLVMEKNLSGLGGVYDVTFGDASVDCRRDHDFSKTGISKVESDTFDDYNEKRKRWEVSALSDLFKL